ncbi:hypothetical protein BC332_31156 [Capsicum chinense]|nr:hypothetical protein BC332_31156 [Capsicum chinense]
MYLLSVEEQSLENHPNRLVLLALQWNLNLSALDKASEEVEWLRNFLEDIHYWPKPAALVCIHCDSQATIGRAGSMTYNGLIVNDAFQVAGIIEKLQPMWKDFKNYLKHKHKDMTVEDLIVRLHIEEDNKASERRSKGNCTINGAHIVKDDQNNSKKKKKVEQGSNQPKKKFKEKCFNYGKIGYKSTDCRAPRKIKKKD